MFAVCGEFLRISKLVLDKSDKESAGRRKRKSEDHAGPVRSGNKPPRPSGMTAANVPEQNHQQQAPILPSKPMPGDEMDVDSQVSHFSLYGFNGRYKLMHVIDTLLQRARFTILRRRNELAQRP